MGHCISAVVLRGGIVPERANTYDLHSFDLGWGLTLLALDPDYTDYWAERLDCPGALSDRPLLNVEVVHFLVREAAVESEPLFAVIETDSFGGAGTQAAVLYHGGELLMPPAVARVGPINRVLAAMGVSRRWFLDEFHAVGLDRLRDFDDLFDGYRVRQADGPGFP